MACQFYVRAIRGRPRAPEWYPGWPLCESRIIQVYELTLDICHARYNDRGWYTVRIKNWASCIPDVSFAVLIEGRADNQELRQTDFMQIDSWERIIDPPMEKSPFLRGIRGPGFFAEPREGGEEEEEDETPRRRQPEAGNKRSSAGTVTPARAYVPATQAGRYPTPTYPQATPSSSTYRQPLPTTQPRPTPGQPALLPSTHGRTIATLMGGPQVVDQVAVREYLPIEVGELLIPIV